MRASLLLLPALSASVLGAPTYPELNMDAAMPRDTQVLSDYFNSLAQKVQEGRKMSSAPVCDLTKAQQPIGMYIKSSSLCVRRSI
jgi:hypothetical protein